MNERTANLSLVIRNHSDILMIYKKRGHGAHKWNFPGGELEFGETLFECAKREANEEYGIEVAPFRLLKVIDHILPEFGQHWVNPILEARLVKGEPKLMEPHKISKLGWFSLEKLPENMTANLVNLFTEVKEGKIKLD